MNPPTQLASINPHAAIADAADGRLRAMLGAHIDSVWIFLRRLGVRDIDDAVQEVILVTSNRLSDVREGSEKSFLFGTAYRVAAGHRRRDKARSEVTDDVLLQVADKGVGPEGELEQREARAMLDQLLASLPIDLRAVFVLYEIEERTMAEISESLSLAPGTVASRLRRARELFQEKAERLRLDLEGKRRPS